MLTSFKKWLASKLMPYRIDYKEVTINGFRFVAKDGKLYEVISFGETTFCKEIDKDTLKKDIEDNKRYFEATEIALKEFNKKNSKVFNAAVTDASFINKRK